MCFSCVTLLIIIDVSYFHIFVCLLAQHIDMCLENFQRSYLREVMSKLVIAYVIRLRDDLEIKRKNHVGQ